MADAFTRSDAGVGGGTATVAAGMDGADAPGRAGGAAVSGGLGVLLCPVASFNPFIHPIAFHPIAFHPIAFLDPIACADRGQTVGQRRSLTPAGRDVESR